MQIATTPTTHKKRGRKIGSKAHSPAVFQYIRENWKYYDDESMGRSLGIEAPMVQKLRNRIGCRRQSCITSDTKTIALICELFANGKTLVQISKIVAKNVRTISSVITKNWLYKKRSFDTITLIMESKINC